MMDKITPRQVANAVNAARYALDRRDSRTAREQLMLAARLARKLGGFEHAVGVMFDSAMSRAYPQATSHEEREKILTAMANGSAP